MAEVRRASRKRAKMRLGICAPAGCGKTMGALLVAYGLTGDWAKVGLADTENGSGELYVGHTVPGTNIVIGEYLYVAINAPFTVNKYMEAQSALENAGCEAIVLDSTSHAWAGSGGLLDKQGRIAAKSGNSYTAWRDVTPEHNGFIEMMLQSPAHIIATMRSKVEYVLETNDKGRQVPRKIGMAPVQREGLDFEFTVVFDIDQTHTASSSKDRTSLFDGEYFKLTPDVGKKMLAWLNKGIEAEPVAPRAEPATEEAPPEPARPKQLPSEWMDKVEAAMGALRTPADVDQAAAGERMQAALATFEGEDLSRLLGIIAAARARVAPAAQVPVEAPADDGWPGPTPEQVRAEREAAAA